jgi:serine phosphatase RsbU (regulator of sigma subunit)
MSGLRASLRGFAECSSNRLTATVEVLNRTLCGLAVDDLYIQLLCARFDAAARELTYVSAGHDPVLLLRRRLTRIRRLDSTGALLGLTRRSEYRERRLPLENGDMMVAFSSGIHEIDVLEIASEDPEAPVAVLAQRIVERAGSSDRTVAVVRFNGEEVENVFEDRTAEPVFAAA